MRDVLVAYQETPISLAREGLQTPGSSGQEAAAAPVSSLHGGSGQFIADLMVDLPS